MLIDSTLIKRLPFEKDDGVKLCKHCGGDPVLEVYDELNYRIACWWNLSCCTATRWYETKEEAIVEWNENNEMPYLKEVE